MHFYELTERQALSQIDSYPLFHNSVIKVLHTQMALTQVEKNRNRIDRLRQTMGTKKYNALEALRKRQAYVPKAQRTPEEQEKARRKWNNDKRKQRTRKRNNGKLRIQSLNMCGGVFLVEVWYPSSCLVH